MPVNETIETLERLRARQSDYRTKPLLIRKLAKATRVCVDGPPAVRRNTAIKQAFRMDPDFMQVTKFTTQPDNPLLDHDLHTYRQHNQKTVKHLARQIKDGSLLNYSVAPETGYVSGMELSSYDKPYILMDRATSSVEPIKSIDFAQDISIILVSSSVQWIKRFSCPRYQGGSTVENIRSGVEVLNSGLEQDNTIWIDNTSMSGEAMGAEIIALARNAIEPNPRNRFVGEKLLKAFNAILDY